MKNLILIVLSGVVFQMASAQSIGVGTTNPHPSAALEIKSTGQGILFPRLNTAQRNTISNPANGLHVFNTDQQTLNYYDSVYGFWNSYDYLNRTEVFVISTSACNLNFYQVYGYLRPARKYLIIIPAGIQITGCNPGDTALNLSEVPENTSIEIRNYGEVQGAGGRGGNGTNNNTSFISCSAFGFSYAGQSGQDGGPAISTRAGVQISVTNYGIVGGGGGGGASGSNAGGAGYGGGGGGGAGLTGGSGGNAGRLVVYGTVPGFPTPRCNMTVMSQAGLPGSGTVPGAGGLGASGGGNGGLGGARGQNGLGGSDGIYTGGNAGHAIKGGSGNIINNTGGGLSFGIVD